jgi:hypothetical protein
MNPDYLWSDRLELPMARPAGHHTVGLAYSGSGSVHAKIDAILLQPAVEWKVLANAGGQKLALYKSLTDEGADATLPNDGRWEVRLYDRDGRLIATVGRRGGEAVTLPAYGFAMAAGE